MSKYTTQVRFICENYAGYTEQQDYDNVDTVIASAWSSIFNDFPIWNEDYRSVLACKILKHYYTREIGAETVGLWKLWLNERMELIMPYYNQLYETVNMEYDPLSDVDYTLTGDRDMTGKETTSNVQDSENTRTDNLVHSYNESAGGSDTESRTEAYSDTPQGAVSALESLTYLSEATITTDTVTKGTTTSGADNNTGTQKNAGTVTDDGQKESVNTDDYVEKVVGKRGGGSYQSLVKESIELLRNIDSMVIEELRDLFLNVY